VTHSEKATKIAPSLPNALAAGKSWFGTFAGTTAKLPKDRLLRIGFGTIEYGPTVSLDPQGRPIGRELVLSTTHQFKLPRL
jgi:hypothetical protein